jgi:hypothetical protein
MFAPISKVLYKKRFWIVATCIYLSIIYSASLHYAFGSEQTITLSYFTESHLEPPNEDALIVDRNAYERTFSDRGTLQTANINANIDNFWKLSDFHGDSGFYIIQAQSFFSSIAPYKYRFLPSVTIGLLSRISSLSIPLTFALFNVILAFCTALLFTYYLNEDFGFPEILSLVGGMLFLSMIAVTSTLPFPILEPSSLFFTMLIFLSVIRKNIPLFIASSILGVATKEILAVSSLLWIINNVCLSQMPPKKIAQNILIGSIPIITFAAIRIGMGGSVAEVNYGYNILAGQFPRSYAGRLIHPDRLFDLIIRLFLSFSFLWTGIMNIRRNTFLFKSSIIIPVVIIAAILLSSRVERVLGILFPVVIPAFLLFFSEGFEKSIQKIKLFVPTTEQA